MMNIKEQLKQIENSDWKRLVYPWDYNRLVLAGWPAWEKSQDGEPHFVKLSCTEGEGQSSRDMAVEWDDLSEGNFYYRDYTESGIPFVDDGEQYGTIFVFQYKRDKKNFIEHFELSDFGYPANVLKAYTGY